MALFETITLAEPLFNRLSKSEIWAYASSIRPNRKLIEGKRVLLVDDSIVRGTTSTKIVRMIRDAGASEVHFRSASPPIKHPDFYGVDMPNSERLLAANHDLETMNKLLGSESLGFLSNRWALLGNGDRGQKR